MSTEHINSEMGQIVCPFDSKKWVGRIMARREICNAGAQMPDAIIWEDHKRPPCVLIGERRVEKRGTSSGLY